MIMNDINSEILSLLFESADSSYRDFQIPTIPTVSKENIIGVRLPKIRALAKDLSLRSDIDLFLKSTPHRYYDENNLHAAIIALTKDFDRCVLQVEEFLPYIDNWATCDTLSPKVFAKQPQKLLPYIDKWLLSDKVYTIRFGVNMLMKHFLGERFEIVYTDKIAAVRHDDYYVKMSVAWYFATALTKQYDTAVTYIENRALDTWTHNKAIQKAIESRLIDDSKKAYLRSLKINNKKSRI